MSNNKYITITICMVLLASMLYIVYTSKELPINNPTASSKYKMTYKQLKNELLYAKLTCWEKDNQQFNIIIGDKQQMLDIIKGFDHLSTKEPIELKVGLSSDYDRYTLVIYREGKSVSYVFFKYKNDFYEGNLVCSEKVRRMPAELVKFIFANSKYQLEKIKLQKGITESQLNTLLNLRYTEEELTQISEGEIAKTFAPGAVRDGMGMLDLSEEQFTSLQKLGIDRNKANILGNLGYSYQEIQEITKEELTFIFPNTQLVSNLVKKGYKESDVKDISSLNACGYDSYKQIIKKALSGTKVTQKSEVTPLFSVYVDYEIFDSIKELSKVSTIIIKGEVTRVHAPEIIKLADLPDGKTLEYVFTVSDVRVIETMKGDIKAGETIQVKQYGGLYKGAEYRTDAPELFVENMQGIFFLDTYDAVPASCINPTQGFLKIVDGKIKIPNYKPISTKTDYEIFIPEFSDGADAEQLIELIKHIN